MTKQDRTPMGDNDFNDLLQSVGPRLRTIARALTGDPGEADDLLQTTLERLLVRWRTHGVPHEPFAYARKTLVHRYISEHRRARWSRETTTDVVVESRSAASVASSGMEDHQRAVADRDVLMRALASLPQRQREAVVLRYFEDLSIEETAAVLRCSQGSVKRSSHRGLVALRDLLQPTPHAEPQLIPHNRNSRSNDSTTGETRP